MVAAGAVTGPPQAAAEPFGPEPSLVADVRPGTDGSGPAELARVGSKVLFVADDGEHGEELWVTDGTAAGTRLLVDLGPGYSSSPHDLVAYRGAVFFVANTDDYGEELWKTDGTRAGTDLVLDINGPEAASQPQGLTVAAGHLWFGAYTQDDTGADLGLEPWVSDGTAAGTRSLGDVNPGPASSNPELWAGEGDRVLFVAVDAEHGRELWTASPDGAAELVEDIVPGPTGSGIGDLAAARHGVVMSADDGATGTELWRTDGLGHENAPGSDHTALLADLNQSGQAGSIPAEMVRLGDEVYFSAGTNVSREVWRTDGAADDVPEQVSALGGAPTDLTVSGDRLFFGASVPAVGNGLYVYDAVGGTRLVEAVHATEIAPVAGGVAFTGWEAETGSETWASDGTGRRTGPLVDAMPGVAAGADQADGVYPYGALGSVLFVATTPETGAELFVHTLRRSRTAVADTTFDVATVRRARAVLKVEVSGAAGAPGTVTVRDGQDLLGSARVRRGVARVRLDADLAPGRHVVRAFFSGSLAARASRSRAAVLRVVR